MKKPKIKGFVGESFSEMESLHVIATWLRSWDLFARR